MLLTYQVTENQNEKILLTLLRKEMRLSATMVRLLKAVQGIRVNGEPVYTNAAVHTGDTVTVDLAAAEPECDIIPQDGSVDILFENEGLLAVNKPEGLIVHPTHSRCTDTLVNYISGYLKKSSGYAVCHAVNRLDRDTSGVVLFAKNRHYKDLAVKALATKDSEKEYLALVHGAFSEQRGTVDRPIKRPDPTSLLRTTAYDGQPAVTHYEVVKTGSCCGDFITLLRLHLETGRTHQIRVHTLSIGHPVLGDRMYCTESSSAASERLGLTTQALHAYRLSFTDPVSKKHISITAPIRRKEMQKIISEL